MQLIDAEKNLASPFNQILWPALDWPPEFWIGLLDHIPSLILVFQTDGRILLVNREASRLLGLEGMEGQSLPEHLSALKKGQGSLELYANSSQESDLRPGGKYHISLVLKNIPSSGPLGLVLAVGQEKIPSDGWDLDLRRGTLDESAVMAGAVSQKVGGPLAGIELYASILGEELTEAGDSTLASLIEEIRYGVREVNEYLTSFDSMTKPLKLEIAPHNLADVVDEALSTMHELFKVRGIGILVEQKDLVVEVDRHLMVQLFLNIFLNAVESMPSGGRLIVELSLNRDGQAEVIVTDTGPGVAFNDMKKIFSPFYTTKEQPLGLGLPVSHRIAEAHQGCLIVGSDMNLGARAVVTLPCIPELTGNHGEHSIN